MAINGSGIQDTARVLKISPTTVIEELKKRNLLGKVNIPLLETLETTPDAVEFVRVEEREMDEMWSFVESKKQERWLWHAIVNQTGQLLAYVPCTSPRCRVQTTSIPERSVWHSAFLY